MPLFPMRRQPMMVGASSSGAMPPSGKPMMPMDPLNQGLRQTPRGLFGRLGNSLTQGGKRSWGEVLGIVGAGLQQMDGGTELTDYLQNRDDQMLRRDMWGQRVRGEKMDEAAAEEERAAALSEAQRAREQEAEMEAMIAQLPPDQQMLARMNPQAFVGGMMRHRYPAPRAPGSAAEGSRDQPPPGFNWD
jgi:hypothetical protein